ncbi:putative L-seryl-tRNA(Sec) kinase [Apostichopus japonicus]|uniref:Putative L-seryl-tRNA(Sec) kinase n=1 Tax=Stichopus japonicus TaxID=307972 RepID=A0A2G8LEA5_STIJA|nr:putative L-seryl-tRNA(Sec) kinase [Apostichopus japonicus]
MSSTLQDNVCLALLSGIPAAGKTTLSNLFCEFVNTIPFDLNVCDQKGRLRVLHIVYDKLIPEDLDFAQESNSSTWKQYREQIHSCIDKLLDVLLSNDVTLIDALDRMKATEVTDGNGNVRSVKNNFCESLTHQLSKCSSITRPLATVLLVDDNFFYRSMRYEYYQLARKYSVGFCQVHISCPINIAISRNAQRPNPISLETYGNMLQKMEEPDMTRATWETNYLIVDGGYEFNHLQLSQMWGTINDAFLNPVQPVEEDDIEAKEQSRAASLTSILHQADIILRKCVSESIKNAKSCQKPDEGAIDVKRFAARANLGRTTLLDRIRQGSVVLPPLDVDDDRASNTFESQLCRLYEEYIEIN